ncbi:MAG: LysM peptidoglycan-binding domain-containing protein, partial [Lentisphaeria bacterium]|nr:LysM peptidoglycan-binding domain-containing protein [Lentisphaeria bacterium]
AAAADGTYTVRKGDNIPKIARKLGVKAGDLMAANNLDDAATRRLQVGQKLVVPGKGGAAAVKESAPAEAAPVVKESAPVETAAAPMFEAAPAEAAPAAAPAEAAPAADKVDDAQIPVSQMDQVAADISVRDYLKAKNLTMDEFKKMNEMMIPSFRANGEDVMDAIIPQGTALFIPAAPAAPAAQ